MTERIEYKFNPRLHPSMRHIVPNVGLGTFEDLEGLESELFRENADVPTSDGAQWFKGLRLGRIVTSDTRPSSTYAPYPGGIPYKWGFRFLYNPSTVEGGQSVGNNYIPDPSSGIPAILQQGLESIRFSLLLNRMPDVMMSGVTPDQYDPPISTTDLFFIRKFGTHWDLEYLYRTCNGVHNTSTRASTGEIGILLPNPVELMLGPFRSRGAIEAIQVTDNMFSPDMVPVLSTVTIQFGRFFNAATVVSSGPQTRVTGGTSSNQTSARPEVVEPEQPTTPELALALTPEGGLGDVITHEMITSALESFPDIFKLFGPLGDTILEALNAQVDYPKLPGAGGGGSSSTVSGGSSTTETPYVSDGSPVGDQAAKIVAEAKKHLGANYVLGASGPSEFDCSGLMYYVYRTAIGLNWQRMATWGQYDYCKRYGKVWSDWNTPRKPGDLILFYGSGKRERHGHIGMVLDDHLMIHTANTQKDCVIEPYSSGHWRDYFNDFGRILKW